MFNNVPKRITQLWINDKEVESDAIASAVPIIDHPHHEVHEGNSFRSYYITPHGSELANDGTINIVFLSQTHKPHIFPSISAGGLAEYRMYRGPSYTGGSALDIQNPRDGMGVSGCTAIYDPTISNMGIEIDADFIPGGSGPNASGEIHPRNTEDVWQAGTAYLIHVVNRAGASHLYCVKLNGYLKGT